MPCLHLYKFLQNELNTPLVLFAKDANFIGYATTNQFLSFSSMPIANPTIFQTCIASPHDIKSIQKDCTCTTSRFFFTRKQRGIFLRWRNFFKKKKSVPGCAREAEKRPWLNLEGVNLGGASRARLTSEGAARLKVSSTNATRGGKTTPRPPSTHPGLLSPPSNPRLSLPST